MRDWWLDHWAGACYWLARRIAAAEIFWRQLGDRAYAEWERRNYHL